MSGAASARRPCAVGLLLAGVALLLCSCTKRPLTSPPPPPPSDGFPVTMTDALNESVTMPAAPQRIVSLAPAATEALFALGLESRIVGVTAYCDYPEEAKSKTQVGGISDFSVEKVLGLRPDLVVGMPINPKASLAGLRRAGVPVFAVDPKDIAGIMDSLGTLGRLTGRREQARAVTQEMQQRLDAVRAAVGSVPRSQRPTALLVYQLDPMRVAGGDTFPSDVLEAAGGVNVAADVRGFEIYSVEAVVAKDPQVILAPSMAGDRASVVEAILARNSLRSVAAVREKRVYSLNADTIDRPGPRIVEGVEEVARALHPAVFFGGPGSQ